MHAFAVEDDDKNPILIINSYNSDTHNISVAIADFIEEFRALGGKKKIRIARMNVQSFSESPQWVERFTQILDEYKDNYPSAILLLGQEAYASYLSLDKSVKINAPVFVGMASRNAIILPDENTPSLRNWMPESIDYFEKELPHKIHGGFFYEYDVESNIEFIKKLYPETEHIAFVSGNTYGGVALLAHMQRVMTEKFPDLNLILLDGRNHTIYTLVEELRNLPDYTALLIGTWRIDEKENEGYFMRNAPYFMMEATEAPTFSISSIGFGYWAIGGRMPDYQDFGKRLANKVYETLYTQNSGSLIEIVPNRWVLDKQVVKVQNIDPKLLPDNIHWANVVPGFYDEYKYQIWVGIVVFITITLAFFVSLFFFIRTKKLKDILIKSENELRVAKEAAEESNNLKSAFLANMSHEIRTPLNSIVGFSNIIAMGESTPEEQTSYFEIIQKNSDLLLRLINDILDLSRLETGKTRFSYEKCDIVRLSQQVIATMEYSKNTTNTFVLDSPYKSFELETDVQRIQQVLINLLSNALKFTENGTITLSLRLDEANEKMIFAVTDTGCGIPVEKRKTVFERFEKLHEHIQGTGLGLSICKNIVTKLGGEIWVDPDYNEGARFLFSHPLKSNQK